MMKVIKKQFESVTFLINGYYRKPFELNESEIEHLIEQGFSNYFEEEKKEETKKSKSKK